MSKKKELLVVGMKKLFPLHYFLDKKFFTLMHMISPLPNFNALNLYEERKNGAGYLVLLYCIKTAVFQFVAFWQSQKRQSGGKTRSMGCFVCYFSWKLDGDHRLVSLAIAACDVAPLLYILLLLPLALLVYIIVKRE